MTYKIFLLTAIIIALAFSFFYFAGFFLTPIKQSQACFNSNCFFVELASTEAQREQGLMHRKSLDAGNGMLFIFDREGNYAFWMKNTLIPLDMIWLDKNYNIVFIAKNVQPCPKTENNCPVTDPKINAQYVLEINAGVADKIGLKIGSQAVVDN